jgi:ATP-binding cassette subfamily C protein CydC
MTPPSPTRRFLARQLRARRFVLAAAGASAAAAAGAAALLLGVSGWFLSAAAFAGAAGPLAAQAFNYLVPSAALRGLAILRTAGRYGERLFSHGAALVALAELRAALFAGLAKAPPGRALALSAGEASARLVQDVNAVETAFVRRPALWAALASGACATAAIALASPVAALLYDLGLVAQLVLARRLSERLTRGPAQERLRATGRLKDALGAYLQAGAELQCFGLSGRAVEAVMAHDRAVNAAALLGRRAEALLDLLRMSCGAVLIALVAAFVSGAPRSLAALAILAALAGLEGVQGLFRSAQDKGALDEAVRRLDEAVGSPPAAAPAVPPDDPGIEIDGVRAPKGGRLLIAGPSGAGKTSLLEALVGLRPAPEGRIHIGREPLEHQPVGWARPLFAYAPQDARLITGTVRDNLRLGAPEADEAAAWAALEDAQLASRIRTLPQGIATWIGDGGERLSGGERRRLSLARAFLRPAPWLLLDEPTEGLDAMTEAALVAALAQRLNRTGQGLILISHRAAPRRLCPQPLQLSEPSSDSVPGQEMGAGPHRSDEFERSSDAA